MTNDKIALRELLETGSDTGFLREMIGFTAERLMALETESLCAAAPGERAVERQNQRNGVSIRPVTRRSGQAATAGLWNFSRQFQGRSSCRRDAGWSAMRPSASASQARGSTSLSLAVTISE